MTSASPRVRMLAAVALTVPVLAAWAAPADGAAAPTCHGKRATLVGTDRGEVLTGTRRSDVIVAAGGDDVVRAGGGDDLVCGGAGSDVLLGGPGADRLLGGKDRRWHDQYQTIATGDRLHGGPGDDVLDPGPAIRGAELVEPDLLVFDGAHGAEGVVVDLSRGPDTGRATATGEGRDRIVWRSTMGVVGSPGDDRLVGSGRADLLVGLAGDDALEGGGGRDVLRPDRGPRLRGVDWRSGGGDDAVDGGAAADDIQTGAGHDVVQAGAAPDVVSVRGADGDEVAAGPGADLVFLELGRGVGVVEGALLDAGEPGDEPWETDTLYFMRTSQGSAASPVTIVLDAVTGSLEASRGGQDARGRVVGFHGVNFGIEGGLFSYFGSEEKDEVFADSGRVHADGRGGNDLLSGGPGRNRIEGGPGSDQLSGGDRADLLSGGPGRDRLEGRGGDDRLDGGADEDRVRGGGGTDTCTGEHVLACEG